MASMLRRDFLRRLALTAAGLLVADDALELLTHRKVWAGHDFGYDPRMTASYHVAMYRAELERFRDSTMAEMMSQITSEQRTLAYFRELARGRGYALDGNRLIVQRVASV